MNTSIVEPLHRTWYGRLATVAVFAPLVIFSLDVPAIVLGIDRMNEIDRVTSATLWISLGSGLIAGGSAMWLGLSKSKNQLLNLKQWVGIFAWGPLSALFVCWSINWVSIVVPGETRVVQATAESFRTGGKSLCARRVTVVRQGHTDDDEVCLTGGLGRPVGPDDLSVGENLLLTIHITPIGSTVESIEREEPQLTSPATTRGHSQG